MQAKPAGAAKKVGARMSKATPESPSAMPPKSSRLPRQPNRTPQPHAIIGITAMKVAIRPWPMVADAVATIPVPPPGISAPTMKALRQCVNVGNG